MVLENSLHCIISGYSFFYNLTLFIRDQNLKYSLHSYVNYEPWLVIINNIIFLFKNWTKKTCFPDIPYDVLITTYRSIEYNYCMIFINRRVENLWRIPLCTLLQLIFHIGASAKFSKLEKGIDQKSEVKLDVSSTRYLTFMYETVLLRYIFRLIS